MTMKWKVRNKFIELEKGGGWRVGRRVPLVGPKWKGGVEVRYSMDMLWSSVDEGGGMEDRCCNQFF